VLDPSLAKAATVTTPMEQETAYAYPSVSYSDPHVVRTDRAGKIVFIQLTIGPNKLLYYETQLKLLGKPTLISTETRSQILVAYPEKGEAYIIDGYSNKPIMVQYFPSTTPEELKTHQAKRYFLSPSPVLLSTPPAKQQPEIYGLKDYLFWGVGILFIGLVAVVIRKRIVQTS
jgi:hypothetical protein